MWLNRQQCARPARGWPEPRGREAQAFAAAQAVFDGGLEHRALARDRRLGQRGRKAAAATLGRRGHQALPAAGGIKAGSRHAAEGFIGNAAAVIDQDVIAQRDAHPRPARCRELRRSRPTGTAGRAVRRRRASDLGDLRAVEQVGQRAGAVERTHGNGRGRGDDAGSASSATPLGRPSTSLKDQHIAHRQIGPVAARSVAWR